MFYNYAFLQHVRNGPRTNSLCASQFTRPENPSPVSKNVSTSVTHHLCIEIDGWTVQMLIKMAGEVTRK